MTFRDPIGNAEMNGLIMDLGDALSVFKTMQARAVSPSTALTTIHALITQMNELQLEIVKLNLRLNAELCRREASSRSLASTLENARNARKENGK